MRGYGAVETVDHTEVNLPDAVKQSHPQGIDVLIDLASDADGFTTLAWPTPWPADASSPRRSRASPSSRRAPRQDGGWRARPSLPSEYGTC